MEDNNAFQSLTDYSLQVLDLCRLLWGPIDIPTNSQLINQAYFEEQKRRSMLSNWLHQCILSQPQQQVNQKFPEFYISILFSSNGSCKIVNYYLVVYLMIVSNLHMMKVIFDYLHLFMLHRVVIMFVIFFVIVHMKM